MIVPFCGKWMSCWRDQVHFDTRQYNHIVYEDAEDLRVKLRNRIAATIH
ncbi:MAG: hypothetical protein GXY33_05100 [Phycisphaerae bacterium]|nr:hypothetical protein [Phycisphaerae bacterium]